MAPGKERNHITTVAVPLSMKEWDTILHWLQYGADYHDAKCTSGGPSAMIRKWERTKLPSTKRRRRRPRPCARSSRKPCTHHQNQKPNKPPSRDATASRFLFWPPKGRDGTAIGMLQWNHEQGRKSQRIEKTCNYYKATAWNYCRSYQASL